MIKHKIQNLLLLLLISISFLCFGFTIFSSKNTYSRYISKAEGNTELEVAVPIISDNLETLTIPLSSMVPGNSFNYNFSVTNYDNQSNITQSSMNYTITVQGSEYLPISYELQKDGVQTNILNNDVSPIYVFNHSTMQVHNYKLIISWDASYDSYEYADSLETIKIIINAEQKVD